MTRASHMSPRTLIAALLGAILLALSANATLANAAAPHWKIVTRAAPTYLQPGERGEITAVVVNLGDAPVVGTEANPIVITDSLPEGIQATGAMYGKADNGIDKVSRPPLKCKELRCTFAGEVPEFISFELTIPVQALHAGYLGENEMKVEGANAQLASSRQPLTAGMGGTLGTPFGVEGYELAPEEENGSPDLQAGSHPYQLTTTLNFNEKLAPEPADHKVLVPGTPGLLKNLTTTLPVGLVADTAAVPQCSDVDFSTIYQGDSNACPGDTVLGAAVVTFKEPTYFGAGQTETVPVFNLAPAEGEPARLGFEFASVPVILDTSIRAGEDYAVNVTVSNNSQAAEVMGTILTVWGVPGDDSHEQARGWACLGGGHFVENLEPRPPCQESETKHPAPYLSLPTTCTAPMITSVQAQSWVPGAEPLPPVEPVVPQTLQGCGRLPFNPRISVMPDSPQTSEPTGLNVEVTVPQESTTQSAGGLAEADIKETTMTLPEGLLVNPGSADGLQACGTGEAGFTGADTDTGGTLEGELGAQRFTGEGVTCPDPSKIGEVSILSPLLENELKGYVYLGRQDTSPFISPLVIYLVAEDPVSGVRVKLAGEVKLSESGQLTTVFKNTPALPFQRLRVHLFDGQRASQTTPAYCRPYETTATFVTWSGETAAAEPSRFTPTSTPNGTPCQAGGPLPWAPTQVAGSVNNQAGEFSPFTLTINRPDGDQALKTITVHLPPGAAAMLSSVTPCPEPQAARGECTSASLIGHSTASSGLGTNPVTLGGDVYLTGPYENAPFGLLDVTHAVAGPFDLGNILVRSTITVDPYTAAATVTSDALPQMIKGAPSQIKQINVTIDRPGFDFNPTSCKPLSVTGSLTGYEGGEEPVSTPFQAANCSTLPFKPTLSIHTGRNFTKNGGVSFDVKVTSSRGQANIAKTRLVLPEQLPSRLSTIQKSCPDTVFNSTAIPGASCDEGSEIGEGIAHTPVLNSPLRGIAYLVSHGNREFPDLEFVLRGEGIMLILDGETDIQHGITTSTFNTVPDAPVSTFEALLPAGPHSALAAYLPGKPNLCASNLKVPTTITGQNGDVLEQSTPVQVEGCAGVLGSKETSSRRLAAALRACRKDRSKSKRHACEKAARRRYGARLSSKRRHG